MDTNAVIELVGGTHHISVVTRIELFSKQLGSAETAVLTGFVQFTDVLGVPEPVIQQTIALRQQRKMKLPDALIAATALVQGLTLVTRNLADFKNIPGLAVLNPHDAAPFPSL